MTQAIETCRYCGRQGGDEFSFGPDDPAPGVCPTCIDARMSALMVGAARQAAAGTEPEALKTWLRTEMLELGMTQAWAKRFIDGNLAAFAAAWERTSR